MKEIRTLLKREESYAVHALMAIAEHPGSSAADIAAMLQLPPAFTAKVLRKLVKAQLIASQMGRSGGVRLIVAPESISLLDVIETVSGTLVTDSCEMKNLCATQEQRGYCQLKNIWLSTTEGVREILGAVTLSQLLSVPAGGEKQLVQLKS